MPLPETSKYGIESKALKTVGLITTNNPDVMIKQNSDEEIIKKISESDVVSIKYSEWKRKEVEHKGKMIKCMQIEVIVSIFNKDQ